MKLRRPVGQKLWGEDTNWSFLTLIGDSKERPAAAREESTREDVARVKHGGVHNMHEKETAWRSIGQSIT